MTGSRPALAGRCAHGPGVPELNSIVIDEIDGEATADGVDSPSRLGRRALPAAHVRGALLVADGLATVGLLSLLGEGGTSGSAGLRLGVATLIALLLLGAVGAFDPASRLPGARLRTSVQLVLVACASAVVASLAMGGFAGTLAADRLALVVALLAGAWIGARVIAGLAERRRPARTLVVGTGATAQDVWRLSVRHRECAFEVVGFVDDDPLGLPSGAPETVGCLADLPRLVREHRIERVVVAYAKAVDADVLAVVQELGPGVRVQVVPRLYDVVRARGFELGRISILEAGGVGPSASERFVKRAFDVAASALLLVLLAPLLAAIAVAIKLDDRGPVLFRQRRVGRHGRSFEIYKFRSMGVDAERRGEEIIKGLAVNEAVRELKRQSVERHGTRIGRRLRPAGFDELPQLWNVLRGEMSLVGPRPLLAREDAALDAAQQSARHAIRPGMTGLWQVSGRDTTHWDERAQLDFAYARHWSMTSDLRILARTVGAVVRGSNGE